MHSEFVLVWFVAYPHPRTNGPQGVATSHFPSCFTFRCGEPQHRGRDEVTNGALPLAGTKVNAKSKKQTAACPHGRRTEQEGGRGDAKNRTKNQEEWKGGLHRFPRRRVTSTPKRTHSTHPLCTSIIIITLEASLSLSVCEKMTCAK